MNKEWSELNKTMQTELKKRGTFNQGIFSLMKLRDELWNTILSLKNELSSDEFNAIPFINAEGYHSKTIAYSLWHVFRIEDIVAHTLVAEDQQVFFKGDYQKRINAPIITTGNELVKQEIADFSKELNLDELYHYIGEVKDSTEVVLESLSFDDIKKKISDETKENLRSLHVVSEDENAVWLIDYWCKKDIRGLIQMPFSRHWIMHLEACLRIKSKIHT
jgi:hypothetical protein